MATFQKERTGERMLAVEEAQERVLTEIETIGVEKVSLRDALGRVLREQIRAPRDVPFGDNSAMDGYVLIAADVAAASEGAPVHLRVTSDIPAGRVSSTRVARGEAARIMTGALFPAGADAVVPVELTDAGSETVAVRAPVREGANVRLRGEDMKKGDLVISVGARIGAAEIGVLAGVQRSLVRVGRRPVVAILSTGDEVVDVDGTFEPGKVVNSNSWSLAALVRESGGVPRMLGIVEDSIDATVDAIRSGLESDFVLSTGGVSVGAFDFVKDALDRLGAETRFWQVAMKPGKPLVVSRVGGRLYFGLPGNPVSCMVSFHLFVAPAIRKAAGQTHGLFPPTVRMKVSSDLRSRGDRRQYFRVRALARDGTLTAIPMTAQGSGVSTSMVAANGLAIVEAGVKEIAAGSEVDVVMIGPVSAE
ncbi:MAG: gephyrin-like molybdotransferase Glp [Thermoanaerobaculia bacterium]